MTAFLIIAGVAMFPIGMMVAAVLAGGPAKNLHGHKKGFDTK